MCTADDEAPISVWSIEDPSAAYVAPSAVVHRLAQILAYPPSPALRRVLKVGDKFIQALINDGAVSALDTAVQLADDLLAEHARYLPQFAQVAS